MAQKCSKGNNETFELKMNSDNLTGSLRSEI